MLLCTNGRASYRESDPGFQQSEPVGEALLWEAGVPGSYPHPKRAKEAANTAGKVFHIPCGRSGCCDFGPERWRGPHPPRTELAQEELQP